MRRFNTWLALKITNGVGTMWCAYAFAALALYNLPTAISQGAPAVVVWFAQTFLQLVLLSVILVGQGIMGRQADLLHEKILQHVDLTLEIERKQDARHASALAANVQQIPDALPGAPASGE